MLMAPAPVDARTLLSSLSHSHTQKASDWMLFVYHQQNPLLSKRAIFGGSVF